MRPVTLEQRTAVGHYVAYLLGAMDLRDWVVRYRPDEPPTEGCDASIHPTYGQRDAVLLLGHDFFEKEPSRQREVLVHELVHCHAAGVQHHVDDERVVDLMGKPAYSMWRAGLTQFVENAVDGIAVAWARTLELPSLPRSTEATEDEIVQAA